MRPSQAWRRRLHEWDPKGEGAQGRSAQGDAMRQAQTRTCARERDARGHASAGQQGAAPPPQRALPSASSTHNATYDDIYGAAREFD